MKEQGNKGMAGQVLLLQGAKKKSSPS